MISLASGDAFGRPKRPQQVDFIRHSTREERAAQKRKIIKTHPLHIQLSTD